MGIHFPSQIRRLHNPAVLKYLPFILVGVGFAFLCVPIWVVEYPPLIDYPNHLARSFILNNPDIPELAEFYESDWRFLSNLAYDIVMVPLTKIFPIGVAGKIFVVAMMATLVSSVVLLNYAVYRTVSIVPFISVLFLTNFVFYMGFLAYYLSVSIVIFALACWVLLENRKLYLRVLVGAIFSVILIVAHLYAFGLYGLLVGSYELSKLIFEKNDRLKRMLAAAPLALQFVPAITMFALFATFSGVEGKPFWYLSGSIVEHKIRTLSVIAYAKGGLFILLAFAPLIAIGTMALYRSKFPLDPRWFFCISVGLAVYAVMPFNVATSSFADMRILPPLFAILIAVLSPTILPSHFVKPLAGWIMMAAIVQSCLLYYDWRPYRNMEQTLLACADSHIEAGATIQTVVLGGVQSDLFDVNAGHISTILIPEKLAFVPTLFAFKFQQPVAIKPDYTHLRTTQSGNVFITSEDEALPKILQNFDFLVALDVAPQSIANIQRWSDSFENIGASFVCGGKQIGIYKTSSLAAN